MFINIDDGMLKEKKRKLTDVLREQNIHFPLYCGGNGQCGKCVIRVLEGDVTISAADRAHFTQEELNTGYRIGCQCMVESPCKIEIADTYCEKDFFVPSPMKITGDESNMSGHYGIAIDIGSTTIAMAAVNLENGNIFGEYTGVNHQRSFGTDVMARIQASIDGHGEELQSLIRQDLIAGICKIISDTLEGDASAVDMIAIAGNTTMMHLLRGYDCHGLASYPFEPVMLDFEYMDLKELLGESIYHSGAELGYEDAKVILFPGVSAFIGGDIVSGMWGCDFHKQEKPALFLDLGTNAEMALSCEGKIAVTSVAAGPAFEGGHLSCGTASVPGAIKNVWMQYGMIRYETIGQKPAVGLCGTGVVSAIASFKENHIFDANGTLGRRYANSGIPIVPGRVVMTQQDIREFQKAKAAVCAGLEILNQAACQQGMPDIAHADNLIEKLYLAGGFGCQLNPVQAESIGLLPKYLGEHTRGLGNAVITGLVKYLSESWMKDNIDESIKDMIARCEERALVTHECFNRAYIRAMNFEWQ